MPKRPEYRKTILRGSWGPWSVTIRLREVQGRMEPVEFKVEGERPIDAQGLRRIPFASLVDQAREEYLKGLQDQVKGGKYLGTSKEVSHSLRERARKALPAARRSVPPFEEIAAVYSEAYRVGLPATKAVADRWGVSRTAAAKWVARAREKRLLPTTTKGQPKGART
jgi:hypothetical protein